MFSMNGGERSFTGRVRALQVNRSGAVVIELTKSKGDVECADVVTIKDTLTLLASFERVNQ
jgi:hypothetical protein